MYINAYIHTVSTCIQILLKSIRALVNERKYIFHTVHRYAHTNIVPTSFLDGSCMTYNAFNGPLVRFPHLIPGLHCSPRCQQQVDHLSSAIDCCPVEGSPATLIKAETDTQTQIHRKQVRAAHTCCE